MDGFALFTMEAGADQLHITARMDGGGRAAAEGACAAIASVLDARGVRVLGERAFGMLDWYRVYAAAREKHRHFATGPFSYMEGAPPRGSGLAGIQVHAVRPEVGDGFRVLEDARGPRGRVWERDDATYVHLAGIHGFVRGGREEQAAATFEEMERLLGSGAARMRDLVRTWIWLDGISEGYDRLNGARTARFRSAGLIPVSGKEPPAYLPASTCVGARTPDGGFCSADGLAVTGDVRVVPLAGGLQPPAWGYGSAFSRGVCLEEKGCRQIFVSGTAAIDGEGRSLHPGDVRAQVEETFEVVRSLIAAEGATLRDIRSATIYLKRSADLEVYDTVARRRGFGDLPAVVVVADICRDELLFEMEALAVVGGKGGGR
jgi:enamine deaminase RidA (YjgF/YER057c/UK114 family)